MATRAFRQPNPNPLAPYEKVGKPEVDIFIVTLFAIAFFSVALAVELVVFTIDVLMQTQHVTLDKIIAWTSIVWAVIFVAIYIQLFDGGSAGCPDP
jgi:hypothetical protein